MAGLTSSQVAEQSGVNLETVRYYERRGLIPAPPRTAAGYRLFDAGTIERIRFIKGAQAVGLTLEEIRALLSVSEGEDRVQPRDMMRFADEKIREIEETIRRLERFKSLLEEAKGRFEPSAAFDQSRCPIMRAIREGGG